MRPIKKSALLFAVWFVVCSIWFMAVSYAAVPPLISYQGKLSDSQGKPITGTRNVTFRLYDSNSGGIDHIKWQGTYSVTLDRGIFNIMLGDMSDSGYNFSTLPFDMQYWLGIQVEGNLEMTPLQPLASAAYTFNAERLNGKAVTEFSLANHTHDASNINAGILPVSRGGSGVPNKTISIVQYTGNGLDNRTVAHGLGTTPTYVRIFCTSNGGIGGCTWGSTMPAGRVLQEATTNFVTDWIKAVDSANVTLGTINGVNANGYTYVMICMVSQ